MGEDVTRQGRLSSFGEPVTITVFDGRCCVPFLSLEAPEQIQRWS